MLFRGGVFPPRVGPSCLPGWSLPSPCGLGQGTQVGRGMEAGWSCPEAGAPVRAGSRGEARHPESRRCPCSPGSASARPLWALLLLARRVATRGSGLQLWTPPAGSAQGEQGRRSCVRPRVLFLPRAGGPTGPLRGPPAAAGTPRHQAAATSTAGVVLAATHWREAPERAEAPVCWCPVSSAQQSHSSRVLACLQGHGYSLTRA